MMTLDTNNQEELITVENELHFGKKKKKTNIFFCFWTWQFKLQDQRSLKQNFTFFYDSDAK